MQIEITQLLQGHFVVGGFLDKTLCSVQISCLNQIFFECFLFVDPKVTDFAFDFLTVLAYGMER